jgi:hypothetical protein
MLRRATSVVNVPAGLVLGLSQSQADARVHVLIPLGGGKYQTQQPVQFKAGEVFWFEGVLPKSEEVCVGPAEPESIIPSVVASPAAPDAPPPKRQKRHKG